MSEQATLFLPAPPWFVRVSGDLPAITALIWQLRRFGSSNRVVVLRGEKMRSFASLYDEISAALQFPYYFGNNFNALQECLVDLEWYPAAAYVVVLLNAADTLSAEKEEDQIALLRLFERVSSEWSSIPRGDATHYQAAVPFHFLLHAERSNARALDRLIEISGIQAPLLGEE
jgi:RNAse (barnase) inhibitor barstar